MLKASFHGENVEKISKTGEKLWKIWKKLRKIWKMIAKRLENNDTNHFRLSKKHELNRDGDMMF